MQRQDQNFDLHVILRQVYFKELHVGLKKSQPEGRACAKGKRVMELELNEKKILRFGVCQ